MMRKSILMASVFALLGGVASAQVLASESFGYTVGQNLVGQINPAGTWDQTGASSTNPIAVVAGNVTYGGTGAPAASGESVFLTDTGQDVGLPFGNSPVTDGNAIYYSLAFSHDGTDIGSTTGDYFAHLTEGTAGSGTAFRGRLFARDNGSGAMILGIRYANFTGEATEFVTGKTIAAGTPAFVVVRLNKVAGTANDTASIFVFTGTNAVPGTEPTPDATTVPVAATVDFGDIGRFGLRQGTAADAPKVTVDEIRVGRTWADVTAGGPPAAVGGWECYE